MGYCTSYTLVWKAMPGRHGPPNCPHEYPASAQFCPACGTAVGSSGLDNKIGNALSDPLKEFHWALESDGTEAESTKWYDHEDDMIELSNAFPSVLFQLHGEGEESGDIWNKWFLNGKMQSEKAKIQIAPFDPAKLVAKKKKQAA